MILCDFWIPGRPVAWTPSLTGRGKGSAGPFRTYKSKPLIAWQSVVAMHAGVTRSASDPAVSDQWIEISFWFVVTPRSLKNLRHQKPDIGNMEKAIEDALQGVLYVNDNQIMRRGHSEVKLCRDPNRQGVRVLVQTITEEDVWIG